MFVNSDMEVTSISPRAFAAMRDIDVIGLGALGEQEIRPLLPRLMRVVLCATIDQSKDWADMKKLVLKKLNPIEAANSIVTLLLTDFAALDTDVRKELMVLSKIGSLPTESALVGVPSDTMFIKFERSEGHSRLRLVLHELFSIQSHCRNAEGAALIRQSELFDSFVYFDEVADALCIAMAELPNTLNLIDIVEALLSVRYGAFYICRLVANSPECFHEICQALINNGDKQDEETAAGKIRMNALRMLCQMNPDGAMLVRAAAVESCRMPGLTVMITLDYTTVSGRPNDLVPFLGGILMGSDDRTRTWFAQYIRLAQKKIEQAQQTTLNLMRAELQRVLGQLIANNALERADASDYTLVQASSILRLYCALRGTAALKFTEEESALILSLVTTSPPATAAGIKLVTIAFCILLSCPTLIANSEAEKSTIRWIKKLVQEEKYFGPNVPIKSALGEMLLLVAIHFHSNQMSAIADLVCATLGMKISIRTNNLSKMRSIFTADVFTEAAIATHAVKVPVTPNLNSNVDGFLPVHCVYQLLKNRAFTKYKVPIHEWIVDQLRNAKAPLHPVLPPLIETYVNSIVVPSSKIHSQHQTTNEPISEEDLMQVFRYKIYSDEGEATMDTDGQPACVLTTQLLFLVYMLLYEDMRLAYSRQSPGRIKKYSAELMSQIPIFYLVQVARRELQNYGAIFSILLRLVATHYPHLCLVQDWLISNNSDDRQISHTKSTSIESNRQLIKESFSRLQSEPARFIKAFDYILRLPSNKLWPLAPTFINQLPTILSSPPSQPVMIRIEKLWWRLNTVFPDNLWILTINALQSRTNFINRAQRLSWDDVVFDPLFVLRCDERVFQCAGLMKITLHILSAFLAASRTFLSHHLLEKPSKAHEDEKVREELKDALIRAQESAAVQVLLECCLPGIDDDEDHSSEQERAALHDVQQIVCKHLHQMFILDKTLAKLVHFQTYDNRLLRLTVEAIPSMHICLEFIPELLSQPDLAKQIFAIELCSHLCVHYSTAKFLSTAKLCFNVSSTLLRVLSGSKRTHFFIPVLPALIRMVRAFPPLCHDATVLLNQLESICISKMAAITTTFISARAAKQKYNPARFSAMSVAEYKRYFARLHEDDALFLTIQQSFSDLKPFQPVIDSTVSE